MSELIPFHSPPWKHQEEGVRRALATRDFAFFFEQGAGKSKTTIDTIRNVYAREKRVMRTLVLAPVVVCENWRREFCTNSKIGHLAHVLAGSEKARLESFKIKSSTIPPHIMITNYEALQMKSLVQAFLNWGVEILVCDESQRLKSPDSVRSKMAATIARTTRHNYILSGTPILNSPMDIFAQFRVLDRGATFGDNFFIFRHRYFEDRNAGMPTQRYFPDWKPKKDLLPALSEAIYRKAMRVTKKECLDLPDLVRMEVHVEMGKEQRRVYDEMRKDFIAYLDNGEAVTAQVAVVKALRLQQIATGYAKTEEGEEIVIKDNPRLKALEELLLDVPEGEKVIIWSTFHENYRQIGALLNKLKWKFTELHGGVSGKERQANIDAFQKDPDVRAMVANQKAGGVGVNLTAASLAIFYSKSFSLEDDLQAEARNHRGGSEIHQKITRIDLVALNSIDEIINEALKNKLNLAETVLQLRNKV